MDFVELPKPLRVTEWPTSESLRGPHEGFRESFSFSLSLLPSPRCRKSCGFRGSGQGEAGGWPPPPPDHHLTAAHPSNIQSPSPPRNLKYPLFLCVCECMIHELIPCGVRRNYWNTQRTECEALRTDCKGRDKWILAAAGFPRTRKFMQREYRSSYNVILSCN